MTRRVLAILGVVVLGSMTGLGVAGVAAQTPRLPAGVKSSFDTEEATVLKVFSAAEGEHRFVAYLVKWKGFEVIVSDALARSNFKAGDTIRFIAQRIALARYPLGRLLIELYSHQPLRGRARGSRTRRRPRLGCGTEAHYEDHPRRSGCSRE